MALKLRIIFWSKWKLDRNIYRKTLKFSLGVRRNVCPGYSPLVTPLHKIKFPHKSSSLPAPKIVQTKNLEWHGMQNFSESFQFPLIFLFKQLHVESEQRGKTFSPALLFLFIHIEINFLVCFISIYASLCDSFLRYVSFGL